MATEFMRVSGLGLREFRLALREGKINVHTLRHNSGDTLLHAAMFRGELGKTRLLLARRMDVNARNKRGQTPLHEVMANLRFDWRLESKLKCARLLLECGADPNAQDENGQTPLHYVKERTAELVRYAPHEPNPNWFEDAEDLLIEHGADPDIEDNDGRTPAQLATDIVEAPRLVP